MWIKPGSRVFVTLTDGTTLQGRARFRWAWWLGLKLAEVTVFERTAPTEAEGTFVIPQRSIVYAQVVV